MGEEDISAVIKLLEAESFSPRQDGNFPLE